MQTLKTALVVTFLLVVLYGVYVTLNKPPEADEQLQLSGAPQQWSTPDVELAEADGPASELGAPSWDTAAGSDFPLPQFPTEASAPRRSEPRAAADDVYAAQVNSPPGGNQQQRDGSEQAWPPAVQPPTPAYEIGEPDDEEPASRGERPWEQQQQPDSRPNYESTGRSPAYASIGDSGASNHPYDDPAQARNRGESPYANAREAAPTPGRGNAADDDSASPYQSGGRYPAGDEPHDDDAQSRAALAEYTFKQTWSEAQAQLNENKFALALVTLTTLYRERDLAEQQRQRLLDMLDKLAGTVIYSTEHRLEPPYDVARGESLEQIAQKLGVPARLLFNINRGSISQPDLLLSGTQLKVMRGPFRAEVDIDEQDPASGVLTLFLGRMYAGRFPVTFGDDLPTPGRTYEVVERLEGKPYYDAAGRSSPARDPNNPYGLYWLGFDQANIGIHGVSRHAGEEDRRGSIRLAERDAADVFGILSVGSQVKILP